MILPFFFVCFLAFLGDRVSLFSPVWPEIHNVDQLASSSMSVCPCLLSAGIKGWYSHAWLGRCVFNLKARSYYCPLGSYSGSFIFASHLWRFSRSGSSHCTYYLRVYLMLTLYLRNFNNPNVSVNWDSMPF